MNYELKIFKNKYYDSVTLMAVSRSISAQPGVAEAFVLMGTSPNKELLKNQGFDEKELESAGPNDLVVAVKAESGNVMEAVINVLNSVLEKAGGDGTDFEDVQPSTVDSALRVIPSANLALISIPGEHAAYQGIRALRKGMNVLIFSDNVPLYHEVKLKKYAHEHGLIVMGPDCGTAIIAGIGLGFANKVRRGPVGIVSASGTGAQEVSVLLDRLGSGISHVIGVGGRDLSAQVGAISMLDGLKALQEDNDTSVIVLISKHPHEAVSRKVIDVASQSPKPVVICFLKETPLEGTSPRGDFGISCSQTIAVVDTLDGAAVAAASFIKGEQLPNQLSELLLFKEAEMSKIFSRAAEKSLQLTKKQRFVRGLFCGGTLCQQAAYILRKRGHQVSTDLDFSPPGNWLVDLGDDAFTQGKPHPMIDPEVRTNWILNAARDESVAIVLLDVVLGFGAHANPGGVTANAIKEATEIARQEGRALLFVVSLCGTKLDPQGFDAQKDCLEQAGAVVVLSGAEAASLAGELLVSAGS